MSSTNPNSAWSPSALYTSLMGFQYAARNSEGQSRIANMQAYGPGRQNFLTTGSQMMNIGYHAGMGPALAYGAQMTRQTLFGVDEGGLLAPHQVTVGSAWERGMNRLFVDPDVTNPRELIQYEIGPLAAQQFDKLPPAVQDTMYYEVLLQQSKRITEFVSNVIHLLHKMVSDVLQQIARIA